MKHATHTMPDGSKMKGKKHKPVMNKNRAASDKMKAQVLASMEKADTYIN